MMLPTAITGSYPRPLWFDLSLNGRSFKSALGESVFREQYLDAVAAIINAQEAAGLDIVTDGDSRFDLAVGGKSWFFYPIERLTGVHGHRDTSRGWMSRHGLRPGKILWEVQEAYQPGIVTEKLGRGPLEYTAIWQVAQRMTDRPVKFGAICAPALASMLWNEYYQDDRQLGGKVVDLLDLVVDVGGLLLEELQPTRRHVELLRRPARVGGGIALHLDFLLCGLDQRRADRVAVGRPGVAFEEAQLRPHQLALLGREGAGLPDPCCVLPPLVAGETQYIRYAFDGIDTREVPFSTVDLEKYGAGDTAIKTALQQIVATLVATHRQASLVLRHQA